jgi:hypothetical protein
MATVACDEDTHFSTTFASDFMPARHSVSVLGVYREGRMAPEHWETVGPYVSTALGTDACEAEYNTLVTASDPLAAAIDDYTREDGPTDALLAQIAPAAKGDLLLVLTVDGRLRRPDGGAPSPSPGPGPGRRARGMHAGAAPRRPSAEASTLEVSALLFSVSQGRSVARVGLVYTGTSVEDAMTKFAKKLAETFPQMQCTGWNRDAQIDPARIRQSIDQEQ